MIFGKGAKPFHAVIIDPVVFIITNWVRWLLLLYKYNPHIWRHSKFTTVCVNTNHYLYKKVYFSPHIRAIIGDLANISEHNFGVRENNFYSPITVFEIGVLL